MGLHVQLLGDLRVFQDGTAIPLPASKKTRALLAYLIVTGHPQRRERLCEMFWDLPDDPRGSLRWSLSKLRQVVNDTGHTRLMADRERVSLETSLLATDIQDIENFLSDDAASARSLSKALLAMREPFLGGVDLPDQPIFSEWLSSERERVARFQETSTERLIEHPDTPPDAALGYAEQWAEQRPYSRRAANAVVHALRRLGRDREAQQRISRFKTAFNAAGLDWSVPKEPAPFEPVKADIDSSFKAEQKVHFCQTPGGVNIAYAQVGQGPPLVKAANWLSHLELDWHAPIWSPLFRELAQDFTFIRYDERGNGLSDWDVSSISFEEFVSDLETVVDSMRLDRFPLLGISQGAAVSIEYAIRHPERVSKLILFGGYTKGWRVEASPDLIEEREAVMTLTRSGWGQDNPAYRQIFSTTFMPGASAEQLAWFDEFQRQTTTPANAVRFLSAFGDIDVRDRLAEVKVPTLVLHSRGDRRIPWETGRDIAAQIPNARFVTLESDNHLLLEGEPASAAFVKAVRDFMHET